MKEIFIEEATLITLPQVACSFCHCIPALKKKVAGDEVELAGMCMVERGSPHNPFHARIIPDPCPQKGLAYSFFRNLSSKLICMPTHMAIASAAR